MSMTMAKNKKKAAFAAVRKAIKNNPFTASVAASLLAMSALGTLARSTWFRDGASELKRSLQGRLARGKADVSRLIESSRRERHAS